MSTKVNEVMTIPLNTAVCTFVAIEEDARISNKQDADHLLGALKLRRIHEEYDKHLTTEPRAKNLLRRKNYRKRRNPLRQ